ncbi:hypothetical protein D3C85_1730460 [compost metagenome]
MLSALSVGNRRQEPDRRAVREMLERFSHHCLAKQRIGIDRHVSAMLLNSAYRQDYQHVILRHFRYLFRCQSGKEMLIVRLTFISETHAATAPISLCKVK